MSEFQVTGLSRQSIALLRQAALKGNLPDRSKIHIMPGRVDLRGELRGLFRSGEMNLLAFAVFRKSVGRYGKNVSAQQPKAAMIKTRP
jgi:hypothetical protein